MAKEQKSLEERQLELRAEIEGREKPARPAPEPREPDPMDKVIESGAFSAEYWRDAAIVMEINGFNKTDIARALKKERSNVSRFLNSPKAAQRRKELFLSTNVERVKRELKALSYLSLKVLRRLMEINDERLLPLQSQRAVDILKMIGAEEATKKDITHTHVVQELKEAIMKGSNKAKMEEKEAERITGNA